MCYLDACCTEKGCRHVFQRRREIFGFIRAHRRIFPVEMMYRVFRVSNSGFYYWLKYPKGKRQVESTLLLEEISKIHQESKKIFGSPRIAGMLAEKGIQASRPRVARIMRRAGIQSIIRKKWIKTTDSDHAHPMAEHVLNRDFSAARPGEKCPDV